MVDYLGVPCTKPWTSLEERHILGEYKACCWMKKVIGVSRKNSSHSFMPMWKGQALKAVREELLTDNVNKICPSSCPLMNDREHQFERVEFYQYENEDYLKFSARFTDNRERTIEAIKDKRVHLDTYPIRLKVHPSNRCNYSCRMCNLDRKFQQPVSGQYLKNIADLLPYLENLDVFGGEPFACKTSREIMLSELLNKFPHVHLSTITNGSLLDSKVLEKLKGRRIGNIEFSLDACTAKTYDIIRKKGGFKKTLSNIDRFLEARDTGSIQVKNVGASFVIQRTNFQEIADFIEFSHNRSMSASFALVRGSSELCDHFMALEESIAHGIRKAETLNAAVTKSTLENVKRSLSEYRQRASKVNMLSIVGANNKSRFVRFISRNPRFKRMIKKTLRIE